MSEVDRAELRRLLDEATPRPWTAEFSGTTGPVVMDVQSVSALDHVAKCPHYRGSADSELIAAAVNALPDLLDALDVAESAIERVRALHRPIDVDVLQSECAAEECEHEFDCPPIEMTVCKACCDLGDRIDMYNYERGGIEHVYYPCPTVRALGGE